MKCFLLFFASCANIILNSIQLCSNKGEKGRRDIGDSVESLGFVSKDIAEMEGE